MMVILISLNKTPLIKKCLMYFLKLSEPNGLKWKIQFIGKIKIKASNMSLKDPTSV